MRKVLIFGDSTCDLPPVWREKLNVGFMPLPVNVGDEPRLDMANVFQDEIFDYYRKTGKLCTTSAPNIHDYVEFWTKVRETEPESDILHFHISSDMTITYSAAYAASQEFENVWPIDTRSVSIGVAMLIIEACRMRDEGLSGQEIFDAIEKMKSRVSVGFVIDDVVYLYRGGRCSGFQAMGGNVLNLHPGIHMVDGKLIPGRKFRGRKQVVCNELVKRLIGGREIDTARIFIANTSFDEESNKYMTEAVKKEQPNVKEIILVRPGCSICVHCGPGTVGLAFMEKG